MFSPMVPWGDAKAGSGAAVMHSPSRRAIRQGKARGEGAVSLPYSSYCMILGEGGT